MEVFRYIWEERPHCSFISGRPIINATPKNFAHVLAKGLNKYPHFRLNPDNIILVTDEEHDAIDQGTEKKRQKIPGDWNALDQLRARLLEQYRANYQ